MFTWFSSCALKLSQSAKTGAVFITVLNTENESGNAPSAAITRYISTQPWVLGNELSVALRVSHLHINCCILSPGFSFRRCT